MTVVGVRFKAVGKVYYFDPGELDIPSNTAVIVETVRGVEYGHAVLANREINEEDVVQPLKKVIRIATPEDAQQEESNRKRETEAFGICEDKIRAHGLDMHLVDVELTFDLNKIIFYFTADGRVDFRELVKDLASVFRVRIELRQVGIRDECKLVGGLGPCGRACCCNSHLGDFERVSIRMAKSQGLSLNPSKISGLCGRLMCCLKYENEHYSEAIRVMPQIGSEVVTPSGRGTVTAINLLKRQVTVRHSTAGGGEEFKKFGIDELKVQRTMLSEVEKIRDAEEIEEAEE